MGGDERGEGEGEETRGERRERERKGKDREGEEEGREGEGKGGEGKGNTRGGEGTRPHLFRPPQSIFWIRPCYLFITTAGAVRYQIN